MLINVDSTIHAEHFVSSKEACDLLGIRRETLYAYASRGLLRSFPHTGKGRGRIYLRDDILRLKARHDARSGHGPVAAGALRWGEPVLDSSITEITVDGPRYRGELATDLVARGLRFEQVAELLLTGTLPETPPEWPAAAIPAMGETLERARRPIARLPLLLATWQASASAFGLGRRAKAAHSPEAIRQLARSLLAALPWIIAPRRWLDVVSRAPAMSERICLLLDRAPLPARVRLVDAVLVLSADHELNVSSFTARVVASSGANLYAVLAAATGAFSGPRHGTANDAVEWLIADVGHKDCERRAKRVALGYGMRGEVLPAFSHRFYPRGDPRGRVLLDMATALAPNKREIRILNAIADAASRHLDQHPTMDVGLVAVAHALGAPKGTATALCALGRAAGWVAHALEQRESGILIRPRARYVPLTK